MPHLVHHSVFSLRFNGLFPGGPWLTGFIEAKDDGSGGDNWSYKSCKAPVKSSPPTNQHPNFYRPDRLLVAKTTVSMHYIFKMKNCFLTSDK